MTIEQLIDNANRQKDFNATTVFKKILEISQRYNLTINDSICHLMKYETKKYNLNLLKLAQTFFPSNYNKYNQDNQTDLEKITKIINNVNINKMNVQPKEKIGCTLNEIRTTKPKIKSRPAKIIIKGRQLKIGLITQVIKI